MVGIVHLCTMVGIVLSWYILPYTTLGTPYHPVYTVRHAKRAAPTRVAGWRCSGLRRRETHGWEALRLPGIL